MNGTGLLTLVLDLEPLINASSLSGKGGDFDSSLTNLVVRSSVLVPTGNRHVITNVFDIDGESLTSLFWVLTSTLDGVGLELLHSGLNLHIWVHLSECLRVTGQLGLYHSK